MNNNNIIGQNKERDYDNVPLYRLLMLCDRCNYEWTTISDAWLVSCPKCGKKVNRPLRHGEVRPE